MHFTKFVPNLLSNLKVCLFINDFYFEKNQLGCFGLKIIALFWLLFLSRPIIEEEHYPCLHSSTLSLSLTVQNIIYLFILTIFAKL